LPTRTFAATSGGGAVILPGLAGDIGRAPVDTTLGTRRSLVVLGPRFQISGTTKDSSGSALGGCTVHLFATVSDEIVDAQVSDANGVYVCPTVLPGYSHYVVAYLAGSPDVAGTTVNTLVGSG
jgi:hypothetical protein